MEVNVMSKAIKTKPDSRIQQEVIDELKWDSRVDAVQIGVTVDEGVVTLTGHQDSYARKMAAQEAAHRVPGVLDVANDIEVKIPGKLGRTDAEIAHAVRQALDWDVWVPSDLIASTVSNGWVILEGKVDLCRERNDVERAIHRLAGVRGVTNRIVVAGREVKPNAVRAMIQQALERRAKREADHIRVDVADGKVTISGLVRSWAEKRAILGAVSHAPGVTSVSENLSVDPLF
jgi:osmotically-inducible protein OsmY